MAKKLFLNISDQWQAIFDAITDLVFIQDTDFTIIKANKSLLKSLDLKEKDVVGKKCYEVLHKSDKPWPCCPNEKTKADCKAHTERVNDSNIGIPLLITTSPLLDEKGRLIGNVHIAKDISGIEKTEKELTESKKNLDAHMWGLEKTNEAIRLLYKELEIKNAELKKLDQLKSDFVSIVSHELRTPLSIIKEGINLVLDEITGKINEKQHKYLSIASQNVDRLGRIINDLLNISKIESGKMELKKQAVLINELIMGVTDSFKTKLEESGIKFKLGFPEKNIEIYADPDRIAQVFVNLIGNALKFTKKGHIAISVEDKGREIECAVSDTGIGIAKDDLPKVFSKFRQFGRQDGPGNRGTGLGLVISKGIIEMHKGNIWLDSTLGKGASFIFTIPKHAPDENEADEE